MKLLDYLESHPLLTVLVVWPLVTGLLSTLYGYLDAHAPRLTAALRAAGLDLPGLLRALASGARAKGLPGPQQPPVLPPGVSSIFFLLAACVFAGALTGCSSPLRSAAEVANYAAAAGAEVQTMVHDECTAPMQELAAQPPGPERTSKALALAHDCDAIEDGYDAFRRGHLALVAGIVAAQSGQGIEVGELIAITDSVAQSLVSVEKAIRAHNAKGALK